jgi:hypothetical protein
MEHIEVLKILDLISIYFEKNICIIHYSLKILNLKIKLMKTFYLNIIRVQYARKINEEILSTFNSFSFLKNNSLITNKK